MTGFWVSWLSHGWAGTRWAVNSSLAAGSPVGLQPILYFNLCEGWGDTLTPNKDGASCGPGARLEGVRKRRPSYKALLHTPGQREGYELCRPV